ncbi:putattive exported protein [Bordetella ansorpii]|uniref:Putattive exported protein n=2 Tax=Bordetella ansorpii TaxID=288768 RepID=A0A157P391_9BORD|nr:putattive exported protein [Bordetella ansorpii]
MKPARSFMGATLLGLASLVCQAETKFPSAPVRIVVSTPAGGASDTTARILAEGLAAKWGQAVIVENKPGASGTIGAATVARAAADGYTLFFGTGSTHVVAPLMLPQTPYDPQKDFTPLAIVGDAPFALFVRKDLPVSSLQDLVAYARKRPSETTFGTTGPATIYEVAARLLEREAQVSFNHVPYKGLVPMAMDVEAGRVDVGVGPIDGYLKSDRLKVLAILGSRRVEAMPDVPTSAQSGFPNTVVPVWAAVWGPSGIAADRAAILSRSLIEVLSQPRLQEKIGATGVVVQPADGESLRALMARDIKALADFAPKGN